MTANVPVCVYSSNPVKKAYEIHAPYLDNSTGLADQWMRAIAYIEYWTDGGTPYSVHGTILSDISTYLPSGTSTEATWPSYTFDADIVNGGSVGGAGEVRGNAQGTGYYSRMTSKPPGGWYSVDPALSGPTGASGRADWLGLTSGAFSETFSLGLNSVIQTPTTADEVFLHDNHAHAPLAAGLVVSPLVITNSGNWPESNATVAYYYPYGPGWIDTNPGWNAAGNHFFIAPTPNQWAYWYYAAPSASDHGASYLQQLRVAALSLPGVTEASREDLTGHQLNIDPSWTPPTAFTDPTRLYANFTGNAGFDPSTIILPGGLAPFQDGPADATHYPAGLIAGIHSQEGERWTQDALDMSAGNVIAGQFDDFNRTASIGGTQYYALFMTASNSGGPRAAAWAGAGVSDAANYGNPTEPDTLWWEHVLNENFTFFSNWYPWIGAFSRGCSGSTCSGHSLTGTKSYDWSSNGEEVTPLDVVFSGGLQNIGEIYFMEGYRVMAWLNMEMMWGPGVITGLETFITSAVDNLWVKNQAVNCAYNSVSEAYPVGSNVTGQPYAGQDATDIGTPQRINFYSQNLALETYAGSSVVTAVAGPTTAALSNGSHPGSAMTSITTATSSGAGATIAIPSTSGLLAHEIVNDVTNGTGPFYIHSVAASGATSITLESSTPTTGIGSGDNLLVSSFYGYPIGSTTATFPSGSVTATSQFGFAEEETPNPNIGAWPPPTSPANQIDDQHFYTMCQDPTGALAWTLNPLGTNCASPAPITFTAAGAAGWGFIVNASCPAATGGTWNDVGDYLSGSQRLAEGWYGVQARNAIMGPTADTTTAIANLGPSVIPLQTTFAGNPQWNIDSSYGP